MELNSQNMKRIMLIVAFGIVLYILLQNFDVVTTRFDDFMSILAPFILGGCIAFVVNIPMNFFENKIFKSRKKQSYKRNSNNAEVKEVSLKNEENNGFNKWKRFISIFLSVFLIIFVLVWLVTLVVPELINVTKSVIQYLSELPNKIKPLIDQAIDNYPELGTQLSELQIDFSNILNTAINFLKNAGVGMIDLLGKTISSTVSSIKNLVIGIIFTFYVLMSKEKIGRNFKRFVLAFFNTKHAKKILEVTALSKAAFTNFITGQLKEALILGILCYIGMSILQIPYSLTISLLTTVTALVPIFGALIGAAVGVLLLLAISPIKALVFLIFIIILQQIETNLIYPKVVGESVGVPGIFVLVAITIGGSFGGILGMLIGLPIVSVIYSLLRASTARRLKEKGIALAHGAHGDVR